MINVFLVYSVILMNSLNSNSLHANASFTTAPATLKEQSFVACDILAPNVSCLGYLVIYRVQ